MSLPDLYQSLDYQAWLRDVFAAWKSSKPYFSYRFVGLKIGMDHSLLVKILQGKRHLTREQARALSDLLGLDRTAQAYFMALVDYARAEKDAEISRTFEIVQSLRPPAQSSLVGDQYSYFRHWWHAAIRSLLDYFPTDGKDCEALAAQLDPPVSSSQARDSLTLLSKLGLIAPDALGNLRPCQAHLSTGERWMSAAVQEYQKEVILLSASTLDRVSRSERDISTLTLSLDRHSLEEIREVLRECRRTIVSIVDRIPASQTNAVYQLNLQFLPLTRPQSTKRTGKTRKREAL